ncbi:PD-(D/E)XK nuclease family protein [Streptomyces sp. NPDC086782]|uniref:PD-(D/E)XK nuclease family protein n=1 Tax=Streptomyces sp. NPDC086782 TaxID=3365757 RepID=UPI00381355A4
MAGVSTLQRSGSRFYIDPDNGAIKVPGVTSVVGMAPKDFLSFWNAKVVAETAVEQIDTVVRLAERDPAGAVDYLKGAPRRQTRAASDLGTAAHDLFERLARGEEVKDRSVHIDVKRHVRWFREFLDDVQPEFLYFEETVWSDTHQYAGSFDAIAKVDGETVILDWKTSKSIYDSVALQLSAYRYADRIILAETGESVDVPEIVGGGALHVRPEGWALHPVECGPTVFDAFLHLRGTFDWEKEGKKRVIGKPISSGGEFVTGTQRRAA